MAHSHAQTMDALGRANEIRIARAALKHQVADGEIVAAQLLLDVPDCARTMSVAELLTSQNRWGTSRTSKFCAGLGLPETKTVGSLTTHQRAVLAGFLPDGEAVSAALGREADMERLDMSHLCQALNGSGPCVRSAAHEGLCVVAIHRAGVVYFREFSTRRLIGARSTMATHGYRMPPVLELAAMLAEIDNPPPERTR